MRCLLIIAMLFVGGLAMPEPAQACNGKALRAVGRVLTAPVRALRARSC